MAKDAASTEAVRRAQVLAELAQTNKAQQDDRPPPPEITTVEALREHLWRTHGTTVGTDDPLLMVHTLHQVFLGDWERAMNTQRRLLSQAVAASAQSFAEDARRSIEGFKDEVLTDALRQKSVTMNEAAKLADQAQARFRRLLRTLTLLTTLNIGVVLIFSALVLTLVQ
ncbi:hypothetical protein [Rhodospirillum sp. A1_3_36]|uniref:hypothetical protein n=1 Tax=Rhodospirillum sp. A1_3_36 TaxID=3391666 RepID=UPI0039A5D20A